ncbi:hypothetical protein FQN49_002232 [Arthroderma sp. PD_2]|nr:hypothetical protein FQN49_002232 [Arthroderma sp. PD_2]
MLPPQPEYYSFSPHPWMPQTSTTAGAIPLSVPQSPYPMYPRPAHPPPPSNIMCQPVYRPASRDTYINHPSNDPVASQRPHLQPRTRTASGSSSSDNGVKITNDNPSVKKDAPPRRRRTSTKSSLKTLLKGSKSKASSTKDADTPKAASTAPDTSTALNTSKTSSSKSTAGRSGFTRPKRKKHRWI